MTTTCRVVVLLAALLGLAITAAAADRDLASSLRAVVEGNLHAYDAKDAEGAMQWVHTRSPEYGPTKAAIVEQFRDMDVKAQVVDFRYMGHDDEFAVARVKTKLVGPPGGDFQDTVVDSVVLFHQENGTWKLWSDEVLGVQMISG